MSDVVLSGIFTYLIQCYIILWISYVWGMWRFTVRNRKPTHQEDVEDMENGLGGEKKEYKEAQYKFIVSPTLITLKDVIDEMCDVVHSYLKLWAVWLGYHLQPWVYIIIFVLSLFTGIKHALRFLLWGCPRSSRNHPVDESQCGHKCDYYNPMHHFVVGTIFLIYALCIGGVF